MDGVTQIMYVKYIVCVSNILSGFLGCLLGRPICQSYRCICIIRTFTRWRQNLSRNSVDHRHHGRWKRTTFLWLMILWRCVPDELHKGKQPNQQHRLLKPAPRSGIEVYFSRCIKCVWLYFLWILCRSLFVAYSFRCFWEYISALQSKMTLSTTAIGLETETLLQRLSFAYVTFLIFGNYGGTICDYKPMILAVGESPSRYIPKRLLARTCRH